LGGTALLCAMVLAVACNTSARRSDRDAEKASSHRISWLNFAVWAITFGQTHSKPLLVAARSTACSGYAQLSERKRAAHRSCEVEHSCEVASGGKLSPPARYADARKGVGLQYPPSFNRDVANAPASDNPLIEGGAYATAPDLAKLLLMHMHGGKCGKFCMLSEDAVETMRTDRVAAYGGKVEAYGLVGDGPANPFTEYGLGWCLAARGE
jgi:CubicO group peptidase (beta-lactamase class C family)